MKNHCFWIISFFPKAFSLVEMPISSKVALKWVYQRLTELQIEQCIGTQERVRTRSVCGCKWVCPSPEQLLLIFHHYSWVFNVHISSFYSVSDTILRALTTLTHSIFTTPICHRFHYSNCLGEETKAQKCSVNCARKCTIHCCSKAESPGQQKTTISSGVLCTPHFLLLLMGE